jgi:hypothetical protein
MDQKIRKRELVEKYRQSDKTVKPKPRDTGPQKMFQHFASEAERQQHLQGVAEAQRNGSPF